MPKHFTEEERNTIEAELIKVGTEYFEKYGILKTSISEIAKSVNISDGSFYSFFKSKGDLFMEIYKRERAKVVKRVAQSNLNSIDNFGDMINTYFDVLNTSLKARPILTIVYDPDSFKAISDRAVFSRLKEYNEQINNEMTVIIQEWIDCHGKFSVDADIIAQMLRSLNLLQFHEVSFTEGKLDAVIKSFTEAIILYVNNSKIE